MSPTYLEEDPALASRGYKAAVSWASILAGTVVAVATSLILLALGSGFGLAAVSPWPHLGPAVATFSIVTGIWLIVMQWLSSAFGGYITGRLRKRWVGVHTHEVFFRDTAHGLLTWAVATVLVAGLAASAVSSTVDAGVHAAAATASPDVIAYQSDALFRSPTAAVDPAAVAARVEAGRILTASAATGPMAADDRSYLVTSVAARAGVTADEARARVDKVIADQKAAADKVRDAADKARKTAAAFAIFTAISMLIGAFISCVAAALGGQLRDEHI